MCDSQLLSHYGLCRHPFTDRTAEKSELAQQATYVHADLKGFAPNARTYLFFGKRGSGKTTIRVQMEHAYQQYNSSAATASEGVQKPFFMVNLSKPGYLTACLRYFQRVLGVDDDSWDAAFSEAWTSRDMVDCMLSYAATTLVKLLLSTEGQARLTVLKENPKAARQFLLLAYLYSHCDSSSLSSLRKALVQPRYAAPTVVATAVGLSVGFGAAAALHVTGIKDSEAQLSRLGATIAKHPRAACAALGCLAGTTTLLYTRHVSIRKQSRARYLAQAVRVVPTDNLGVLEELVEALFPVQDSASSIQRLYIGQSGHQKLDLLNELVMCLGYEGLAVFGDCFDEITLLDPVKYPNAIKVFAREVCRNDILNFGRLHFFFPDSRMQLDLNTDKVLKEARFDRHHVRDLEWSRFQLQEVAQLRFMAAQEHSGSEAEKARTFQEIFQGVRAEDLESALAKLQTPREMMICLSEMMQQIEARRKDGYSTTAQDLENAVIRAREQAV